MSTMAESATPRDTCMHVDPNADFHDLHEAASRHLAEASSIITAVTADDNGERLSWNTLAINLWTLQHLIDDAHVLVKRMWQVQGESSVKTPDDRPVRIDDVMELTNKAAELIRAARKVHT